MKSAPFYVTTPIYYVNDQPHIGHAYTTILADVLARYHRLLGEPTFFLTGADEHGQKVQRAAEAHGVTPQEHCDRTVQRFQELWQKLETTHDDFIRTTEPRHTQVVQDILQDLHDRGEIYASDYEGWYCVPCERFFTAKDLADKQCPECGREGERLVERNYFFRMSRYQDWLVEYIQAHPDFIQPAHRRQETLGFLRAPLGDLCISRPKSRLSWGIELPFDSEYVTYVWFDALVNYISAIGYGADPARFERWWPASCQLIGKDILTTHTVYWPTMLKAIGVPMPRSIFAHGWWLVGASKMSKSVGNVVNPMAMAEQYGVDAFRYFLMAEMTLGQDASFTEQAFATRYNADLANDLGNLASRALKMIRRQLDAVLPAPATPGDDEADLRQAAGAAVTHMHECLAKMQLDKGIAQVMAAVREGNRYFERMAPWKLKKPEQRPALKRVLYHTAESLRIVSGLLFPVMPAKMAELRRALGMADDELQPRFANLEEWNRLREGQQVLDLAPLFPRVDMPRPPEPEPVSESTSEAPARIDLDLFRQVQLRVATVTAAETVKGAAKLLRIEVDMGAETRTLVAGIAAHYTPDSLIGKRVVVVANLEPATLFGVRSDGMLLAAADGDQVRLLTPDGELPPGAVVS